MITQSWIWMWPQVFSFCHDATLCSRSSNSLQTVRFFSHLVSHVKHKNRAWLQKVLDGCIFPMQWRSWGGGRSLSAWAVRCKRTAYRQKRLDLSSWKRGRASSSARHSVLFSSWSYFHDWDPSLASCLLGRAFLIGWRWGSTTPPPPADTDLVVREVSEAAIVVRLFLFGFLTWWLK